MFLLKGSVMLGLKDASISFVELENVRFAVTKHILMNILFSSRKSIRVIEIFVLTSPQSNEPNSRFLWYFTKPRAGLSKGLLTLTLG